MNHLSIAFLHSLGFSQRALAKIFRDRTDYDAFYQSLSPDVLRLLGLRDDRIAQVLEKRAKLDEGAIAKQLESLGVEIVTIHDDRFPVLLREIPGAPFFLYVRGTLRNADFLSIVGSRKSTAYSDRALGVILPELVSAGWGIVSWGAYGVDSLSHRLALDHGGYTVSVFGTGIDGCYPASNRELFDRILASGGALVSVFPLDTAPEPYNFPIRNEIVAGMSRGVLVTEAGEKSGTLITAGLALDYGRDVFALPGDITKATSVGSNALIRDGQAKLVTSALDILNEYNPVEVVKPATAQKNTPHFEDETEERIYSLLAGESLDPSSVADRLGIDIATVSFRLSMMEVRWIVEMGIAGGYEVR